ncbi:hypothetical protein GCM10009083_26660 [Halopseudomonas pertucinogena]|uniref:Uncharacterized protein n=1 Tax=Halopseudomonas pertucinogena TaxID=86175 RepID=A0ABQ2CSB6_9GAMM|nr:hypothetical protein GCM10009083_26660 [Halopseudomonas pertucinogena]
MDADGAQPLHGGLAQVAQIDQFRFRHGHLAAGETEVAVQTASAPARWRRQMWFCGMASGFFLLGPEFSLVAASRSVQLAGPSQAAL